VSLFTFITDTRAIARELKRIGDALERIAPPTGDPTTRMPAQGDDVSYASDEETAKHELLEEIGRLEHEPQSEAD
jgi:hypothetical protein